MIGRASTVWQGYTVTGRFGLDAVFSSACCIWRQLVISPETRQTACFGMQYYSICACQSSCCMKAWTALTRCFPLLRMVVLWTSKRKHPFPGIRREKTPIFLNMNNKKQRRLLLEKTPTRQFFSKWALISDDSEAQVYVSFRLASLANFARYGGLRHCWCRWTRQPLTDWDHQPFPHLSVPKWHAG